MPIPVTFTSRIPGFTNSGHLEEGDHLLTTVAIQTEYVDLPDRNARASLYNAWRGWASQNSQGKLHLLAGTMFHQHEPKPDKLAVFTEDLQAVEAHTPIESLAGLLIFPIDPAVAQGTEVCAEMEELIAGHAQRGGKVWVRV